MAAFRASHLHDQYRAKAAPLRLQSDTEALEVAADQAIAACGGDEREAMKALLIANEFLERDMEENVSRGYIRGVKHGRFNPYSG